MSRFKVFESAFESDVSQRASCGGRTYIGSAVSEIEWHCLDSYFKSVKFFLKTVPKAKYL